MEITLTRNASRKGNRLIYAMEGRPGSVQFTSKRLFSAEPPATLKIVGEFAPPKVKETPEERKARLKAMPKPTPAERLAKMEARIAKMKAQLAAAPTAEQPAAPAPSTRPAKGRKS